MGETNNTAANSNSNCSDGIGDDFFDDKRLSSASPSPLGSSPNFRGGGGRGAAGSNKKKRRPRKNNAVKGVGGPGGQQQQQHQNNNNGDQQHNNNNTIHHHHSNSRSRESSPKRHGGSRSRENSPKRAQNRNHHHHHYHHHYNQNCNDLHHHYNPKKDGPPDITVVVNRVDLYDSAAHIHAVAVDGPINQWPAPPYPVEPYSFVADRRVKKFHKRKFADCLVAIQRVPYSVKYVPCEELAVPTAEEQQQQAAGHEDDDEEEEDEETLRQSPPAAALPELEAAVAATQEATATTVAAQATANTTAAATTSSSVDHAVVDNSIPNPYDKSIDKYWAQRRRLFTKFDLGIQLDAEGWYSVTPEIIADHVAHRVGDLARQAKQQQLAIANNDNTNTTSSSTGWVVLDAFCGCGGNGIAFSRISVDLISLVVCVDTDRNKLRMAAHNASLYNIPTSQIVFVECNSIFILKHCYRNGDFILDQPELLLEADAAPIQLPSPVPTEVYKGYHIGGINMLPRRIDVVFMDPPWGGVDYEVLGKNGYDLEKNMKIKCQVCLQPDANDTIQDDFFDSFQTRQQQQQQQQHKSSRSRKKANFNNNIQEDYVNGAEMLQLAAAATQTKMVLYDLPRNTNKTSLGQSALAAGYRGNIKLEEHFLNGRLKTVTAYFGTGFEHLLNIPNRVAAADQEQAQEQHEQQHQEQSHEQQQAEQEHQDQDQES